MVYEVHVILEVSPGLKGSEHVKQEVKKLEEKAASTKKNSPLLLSVRKQARSKRTPDQKGTT